MNETLSVKDISSHVFLSTSYVCTFFKNETGQTLNQYLTEYRMEKAKQLLKDARFKISDQSLSRFYKLTLSRKQSISTIAQETEHATIYLEIQNMRYHNSISFVSDIPDELMEYQIPKLTLQPLIENAVLHGILEKDDKTGTIVLTGWIEDTSIVLLISDDGVGIPSEKLSAILSGNGNSTSGGTNIAVYNTHRRLQILYGPDYGLTYSSTPGSGTEVEIRIPAIRKSATEPSN